MSDKSLSTETAYALETLKDRKALYAAWAATYDDDFAVAADYIFPHHVARVFHEKNGDGPVLDAGAGTGLVASAIREKRNVVLDAFDLSCEMLNVARSKGLYRDLFEGDLTQQLPFADHSYASVVSAGTFTHGHVGPDALTELLRIAAPDALFVLSIKADLYTTNGFDTYFASNAAQITGFEVEEVPIYGAGADESHAGDMGFVVSYRRV